MASWESLPEEQRQARIMQLQMAASMKRGKAISEWVVCWVCMLVCRGGRGRGGGLCARLHVAPLQQVSIARALLILEV